MQQQQGCNNMDDLSSFNPDAYLAGNAQPSPSPTSVPVDPLQVGQFNPDQYLMQKQNEAVDKLQNAYGDTTHEAQAFGLGAARGATLGASDYAAQGLGYTADELTKIKEANPISSFLGQMAGNAGLLVATGGIAAPVEGAMGATAAARMLGYAAEGATLSAGNVVSEQALGDPDLNAQKILSEVGIGAAFGAGLGGVSKLIERVPALLRSAKGATEVKPAVTPTGETPVVDVPVTTSGKPSTIDEMQKRVDDAVKYSGKEGLLELPEKQAAIDASQRLGPITYAGQEFPITEPMFDSLSSQQARLDYKQNIELGGKVGETLSDYQGIVKKALIDKADSTIDNIAPGYKPTNELADAGQRINDILTTNDQALRDEVGPAIEHIKNLDTAKVDHLPGVLDYLTNPEKSVRAQPAIAEMFDTGGDSIQIKPYNTGMGIDSATYKAVKQAVEGLQENPEDYSKLFNIRKGLDQNIDVMARGTAPREITNAKAAMMDYIQDFAQAHDPDINVRDTMRKWAVNEQNKEFLEDTIKARVGSDWRSIERGKTNPEENVINKIFANSANTEAVKSMMSEQQWNQTLADYMASQRTAATDTTGVFSSNKFNRALESKKSALDIGFQSNPKALQDLRDSTTLMRIFPDAVPANPPHTARTLLKGMAEAGFDPVKQFENLYSAGKKYLAESSRESKVNQQLAGASDKAAKMGIIQSLIKKTNDAIKGGVKDAFTPGPGTRGAVLSIGTQLMSNAEYKNITDQIKQHASNPETFADNLAENTAQMHEAAPMITQGLHTSLMQGVNFLNSKIARPATQMALDQEYEPSRLQRMQFGKYYAAVNNPTNVLANIKDGSLSNEHMEALTAVHPKLLQEMRQQVIAKMNPDKARSLPYPQKVALSKFLGQPLESNLTPTGIMSNQAALNMNLSAQSAPQTGRKSTLGGLKQLKASSRVGTIGEHEEEEV